MIVFYAEPQADYIDANMSSLIEEQDVLTAAKQLSELYGTLHQAIDGLIKNVAPIVQKVSDLVASLSDEEFQRSAQLRLTIHKLEMVNLKANQFLDQVREISSYCMGEADMMKRAQKGVGEEWKIWRVNFAMPDFRPLNDLINQLTRNMSKAEEHYKEIEGNCSTVIDTCAKEAEICQRKGETASYWKGTAIWLSGASVVTIGAGVMSAIYGIVARVHASAVAIAGIAATGALGFANKFKRSEERFGTMGRKFVLLMEASLSMKKEVYRVNTHLMKMCAALEDVDHQSKHHKSIASVQAALERLVGIASAIRQDFNPARHSDDGLKSKL